VPSHCSAEFGSGFFFHLLLKPYFLILFSFLGFSSKTTELKRVVSEIHITIRGWSLL
jgi:hypothetical protein